MSAVETVRDIPLIIEYEKEEPMDYEVQSGFPFDRHNRDGSFRDQLEDIAKRHPEFADHLLNFKQRGFREKPQGRSFDTFDKWGFPEDFPEEQFFRERFEPRRQSFTRSGPSSHEGYNTQQAGGSQQAGSSQQEPAQQQYYQQQQAGPAQETPAGQEQQQHRDEQEQPQEIGRAKNNIQQSNTVDLGQKSEPVNERNQRSMSAPPENRQRFVSSINIPVGRDAGAGDNPQQPHDQQQPKQHGNVTERVIPIHVEGRDDPVMPRHANATFSQPERVFRPDPEPVFAHRPEPERIFGQRPEHFTQFVHEPRGFERDAWHDPFERYPEEFFGKRGFQQQHRGSPQQQQQQHQQQQQPKQQQHYQQPPHSQQQQHYQQAPPQQQQQHYQQPPPQQQQQQSTQQPPQQQQEAPQPKPQQNKPLTPMEKIQVVQKDVADLMEKVEKFEGVKKDKYYLYLDEMLTRNLIALDDIDTQGQDTIRTARKEAIKCIQKAISVLENKATDPNAPKVEESTEKMEVEEKPQETESSQMEAEVAASENKAEEGSTPDTKEEIKMEVAEKPVEDVAEEKKEVKEEPSAVPVETKGDEKPAEVQQEEANIVEENTAKVSDTIQKFENKEGEGKSEEKSSEVSSEKTDEVKTVESAEEKPAEAKDATEEMTDKAKDEKKEKKKTKKKAEKKE